jgi:hypothetical protein
LQDVPATIAENHDKFHRPETTMRHLRKRVRVKAFARTKRVDINQFDNDAGNWRTERPPNPRRPTISDDHHESI